MSLKFQELNDTSNNGDNTPHNNFETTWNGTLAEEYHHEWMASLVLCCFLLTLGIYLFITLSLYEYKVLIKNRKVKGINRGRLTIIKDRSADWMRWLCLAACVFFVIRVTLEILEVLGSQKSESICNSARHSKAVLLCVAVTCIYLVLWLRQRKFYNIPAMEHLSNKPIRFFSASVIVLMVAADVITIALFLFTRYYKNSPRGCVLARTVIWSRLPGLLLFIFTISFQIILLGLLIYPLYKHRTASALVSQTAELKVMKRVSIAAVVAVTSTAITSLLAITAFSKRYGALRQLTYDLDSFVSLLSVIFSFSDWRARLFACGATEEKIVGTRKGRLSSAEQTSPNTITECQTQKV